jgi:tetratricopeptide (TPR) repeat protein
MAHIVPNTIQNPAARLRASVDTLESTSVAPSAATVEALLLQLDETQAQFAALEAQGLDLRAERVRWENLTRRLGSRPQLIANAARGLPGGMAALRSRHGRTPEDAFWWSADLAFARRRRRLFTEIAAILVGIPLLLGLIYWGVTVFFPPDPAAVATLDVEAEVDKAVAAGDVTAALIAAEEAFAGFPDQANLAVWVAILANEAGEGERAADAENAAAAIYGDDVESLWLVFADHHARIGNFEASIDYAQRTIARNPENATAWYHQGRAAAQLGDRALALESLDQASRLAEETSPELAVNARLLLADLMRQPDFGVPVALTATIGLTTTQPATAPQP